jgi:hypothetical protein
MGRAEALQWHNHFLGDPGAIRTEMERFMAVTADDIRGWREYLPAEPRRDHHPARRGRNEE